jgi:hypothetical protein
LISPFIEARRIQSGEIRIAFTAGLIVASCRIVAPSLRVIADCLSSLPVLPEVPDSNNKCHSVCGGSKLRKMTIERGPKVRN